MRIFRIALSGDYLNEAGESAYGDLGWSAWDKRSYIRYRFLTEQAPRPGDPTYWERFYSLQVTPEQIAGIDGLVVVRPWIKRDTFRDGAKDLVVIGRSGAGYDKIDLDACTDNDVALFNAPLALNHSTASSALLVHACAGQAFAGAGTHRAAGPLGLAERRHGRRIAATHAGHRRPGTQRP